MHAILLTVLCALLLAPTAYADVYKYVDENGVLCFTDAPLITRGETVYRDKTSSAKTRKAAKSKHARYAPKTYAPVSSDEYRQYVSSTASKYQIEADLIHAVIKTESNGNHRAVSRKGAMGLMQLMPSTANDMNVVNPFNPEENIEGGTRYLRYMIEKFNGNVSLALAAYNAGPKTVERYGAIPPIFETREYVKRVLSLYKGKQQYDVPDTVRPGQPTAVYKVVLEDGTILFTNSAIVKQSNVRF